MSETDRNEVQEAAAFMGSTTSAKTMADGTLRVSIDFDPRDTVGVFTAFGAPGSPVAVARLSNEAAVEADRPKAEKGPWGDFAKDLLLSGFFRSQDIWEAIGTDDDYLLWVKSQPSAKSGEFDYYENTGDKWCVAAHVRHLQHGGGTAIKPEYSAIPLTNAEHQLQHDQGESAIGDREWWDKQRIKHLEKWARETLREQLGHDSWTNVDPQQLLLWVNQHNLERYLPQRFGEYLERSVQETTANAKSPAAGAA